MKNYILNSALAAGVTLALASCGENTWNDKYLDGFEGGVNYETPSNADKTYSLVEADYKAISKAILAQEGLTAAQEAEAKAIASTLAFDKNGFYPASVSIPLFTETRSFPYYLDPVGSNAAITYDEYDARPEELASIAAATAYKVTTEDYQTVWGSDENYTEAFAPSHTATSSLPAILAANIDDAQEGDYAIVSYNTSATDPVFGAAEEPAFQPSSVLGGVGSMASGDDITFSGVVMAVSTQGPVIADATGALFTYAPSNNSDLKVGDQVTVNATLGTYNNGWQTAKGATPEVVGSQAVTYPAPRAWTGSEMDAFSTATVDAKGLITPIYSKFTGKVTVSGNYTNIIIDGGTTQVSPYGASNAVKALLTDGATVTFEGYVVALASKGKYFNTIITKIGDNAFNTLATTAPAKVVKVASTAENAVYYYNGSKWAPATGVSALNPADYAAMGFADNSLQSPEVYIPMYLKNKFIYALAGDQQYVAYNGNKVGLFVFDGSEWTLNNDGRETVTARFNRKSTGWTFVKYLGKAVFNILNEEQPELDRSYLFVFGDECAIPVAESRTYGYLYMEAVSINNGVIVMASDNNAFSFLSAYVDEEAGVNVKAPEGYFLIKDNSNRYYYLSGYNSPNLKAVPDMTGGAISENFLWKATRNADGTWDIVGGNQTMHLSPSYNSVGFYSPDGIGADMVKPVLYMLD
ncbi:MAG: hypothetical protein K2N28_02595 [Muribaculaceae bacterium]|nr:hypothetical protein [Muribaculaceae bacterium]